MQAWFKQGIYASNTAKRLIANLNNNDIETIAVIRHQALGDMVLIRSFLIEAKKAFPNAKITLSLIEHYQLGAPIDLVDRVHVIKRKESLLKKLQSIKALGEHDLIFDLATTPRSRLLCLFNTAKLKFGFPYKKYRALLFYDIAIPRNDLTYEVCDMLNMLHAIGVKTSYPHIFNLPGSALKRDKKYVIYFIGASNLQKMWPDDNYSSLISSLSTDYSELEHIIFEGINSWETADNIINNISNSKSISVVKPKDINFAISLLKGAELVVSNDTGIRHLAITGGTPTVGIFYANPYRYWPRYNQHDIVMRDQNGSAPVNKVKEACVKILNNIKTP